MVLEPNFLHCVTLLLELLQEILLSEFLYIVWFCSCSSCNRYNYLNFSILWDSALIALQQIYLSEFLYTAWFWSRSFGKQSFLLWLHFMFWQMSTPSLFCFVFTFTALLSTAEPNVFSELVVLDVGCWPSLVGRVCSTLVLFFWVQEEVQRFCTHINCRLAHISSSQSSVLESPDCCSLNEHTMGLIVISHGVSWVFANTTIQPFLITSRKCRHSG
jgi:hypothetical protein